MEEYSKLLRLLDRPIGYSDRAKRDMKRAHFTEDMLVDILKNPKKVDSNEKGYLVRGKKTAKIRLKITEENNIFIESFSYNKVPFVF